MSALARSVSVTTSATALNSTPTDSVSGSAILVHNIGATTVYLGGSGVTTATGAGLASGERLAVDLNFGESLYGIVASGTVECRVLEVGV